MQKSRYGCFCRSLLACKIACDHIGWALILLALCSPVGITCAKEDLPDTCQYVVVVVVVAVVVEWGLALGGAGLIY